MLRLKRGRRLEAGQLFADQEYDLGNVCGPRTHLVEKGFWVAPMNIRSYGLDPGPVDTIGLPIYLCGTSVK